MANKVVQEALNHFVGDLRSTHGDNLASVVLYGLDVAGETVESRSDYNVLIALNKITPEDLRLSQAPVREWQRLGYSLPVYFTVAELRGASDVFPIEFHQMERARVLLYGQDPFETLELSNAHLRHQTEYELRSKLLRLRRMYIPASVSVEKLNDLMTSSLTSFAALFAPVLVLHGKEPPVTKRECVRATIQLLRLDPVPFEQIFELRGNSAQLPTDIEANNLFATYLDQIERVIEAVDQMPEYAAQAAGGNPM